MGRARLGTVESPPCDPRGPVRQRIRLPRRPGARRRPRRDFARRPRRAGHAGPAGACAARGGRSPICQAFAQTGAHGMTLNGVAHAAPALIGEVIEASTTEVLAQAMALDAAPPFGAFVEVATDDGLTIYGVVAHVQTAGIDPGSRA